jgi:hypothetical protein
MGEDCPLPLQFQGNTQGRSVATGGGKGTILCEAKAPANDTCAICLLPATQCSGVCGGVCGGGNVYTSSAERSATGSERAQSMRYARLARCRRFHHASRHGPSRNGAQHLDGGRPPTGEPALAGQVSGAIEVRLTSARPRYGRCPHRRRGPRHLVQGGAWQCSCAT